MSSVILLASEVAQLLDGDPMMARQVKEHLSRARICELLEIPDVQTKEEIEAEFEKLEDDELLAQLTEREIPLEKVLAQYRTAKGGA